MFFDVRCGENFNQKNFFLELKLAFLQYKYLDEKTFIRCMRTLVYAKDVL